MLTSFITLIKFYNEKGDIVSSKQKNLNGSYTQYEHEYVYDEIGNWIDEKYL
jgi:hypothetical protein